MKTWILIALFLGLPVVPQVFAASAAAEIKGTEPGSKISGTIIFQEKKGGLQVTTKISGAPAGLHGFHIHENGSCGDKGNAAGGHFNPDGVKHGLLRKDGFASAHAGDLGNVKIKANGKGGLKRFLPGLTLADGKYAVAGKSVILHEKQDDFGQPTGNAGGRIGCGVIAKK